MEFLNEWITNIIVFILLAVVVEMLLPQTSLQKYVKLILGLLLIVMILKPLFTIFSLDEKMLLKAAEQFPENLSLEKSIEKKKLEIQAEQAAYILEQTAVQLKELSETGLVEQFGYRFSDLQLEMKDNEFVDSLEMAMEQIVAIKVSLEPYQEDSAVEAVKEIIINTRETVQKDDKTEQIAKYLAQQWEVDPSIIEIFIEKEAGKNV